MLQCNNCKKFVNFLNVCENCGKLICNECKLDQKCKFCRSRNKIKFTIGDNITWDLNRKFPPKYKTKRGEIISGIVPTSE